MVEQPAMATRFNWQKPIYAALASFLIFLLLMMWSVDGDILYLLIACIASFFALLLVAFQRGQRLSNILMLIVFATVSWMLMRHSFAIPANARWLLGSQSYKTSVLNSPAPANGELKHVDWDGWGFAGNDTEVYLVFDSNGLLATQVQDHSSGKFSGISCEVWQVHRLEDHWYYVVFYTDTAWDDCS